MCLTPSISIYVCSSSGVQCSPADPVAVGGPALRMCGAASQRKHRLLPGETDAFTIIHTTLTCPHCSSKNILHFNTFPPCPCPLCQFTSDARDCESYLRQLQETIKRQYTCDKNSRLSKLEDLLQDSMVCVLLPLFISHSVSPPQ